MKFQFSLFGINILVTIKYKTYYNNKKYLIIKKLVNHILIDVNEIIFRIKSIKVLTFSLKY